MIKYNYDLSVYNFADIVTKWFDVQSLDTIHQLHISNIIPENPKEDQNTWYHKVFYKIYEENDSFLSIYNKFIQQEIAPKFLGQNIVYQTKPTFRVHAPGNIAVAKWHKDKQYNHSAKELNIFLPLTRAFDSNTIWTETEEDKGDYSPMNLENGEYYIWNGSNLLHGNKKNDTGVSRVSLDFRIIMKDDFNYEGTSITTKVPMKIGHYWSELC